MRFVREFDGSDTHKQVDRLISQGDIPSAVTLIELALETELEEIAEVAQESYKSYLLLLAAAVGVRLRFDPTSEQLIRLIRSNRATLIQRSVAAQRDALNTAVIDAYTNGTPVEDAIARAIGLSGASMRAVINYRDSLKRQKRDGAAMSDSEIERMVESYRKKMYRNRSEVIGFSTAVRLYSETQQLAVEQAIEEGAVEPDNVIRVWNRIGDERVRDSHDVMHGQTAGVNDRFIDGSGNELRYPGDPQAPPETTINCRCWLTFKIK